MLLRFASILSGKMPDESKTVLYYVYAKNSRLSEEDPFKSSQDQAFAVKDDNDHHYTLFRPAANLNRAIEDITSDDPRDHMKNFGAGVFHMFDFPTSLTTPQVAEWKSMILNDVPVSRESWSGNILAKMESHGMLTREQKENVISKRRNSVNILWMQNSRAFQRTPPTLEEYIEFLSTEIDRAASGIGG